ncbi:MAG: hypothetical protein ACLSGB_03755 [Dorea sp.]
MQLMTSYVVDTSIFDFLKMKGSIIYGRCNRIEDYCYGWFTKGLYPAFRVFEYVYFPEEQIILTSVLVGFYSNSVKIVSFMAVSQKGVSHYTVILLPDCFLGIIALCGYVIYMMIYD